MTLAEKIATVSKLERIDSSIESCIKILEQELIKRADEAPGWSGYALQLLVLSKVTDWDLDVIIFFAGCCFIEFTKGKKWDFK